MTGASELWGPRAFLPSATIPGVFCDLHLHSTASDGTDAPQDLPRLAKQAGLAAVALTDHDTTAGLAACASAAAKAGIDFVPGIELSADPASLSAASDGPRGTLHVLGYFIRHDDPALAKVQQRLRKARDQRNPEMVEKLDELGVRIRYEDVVALAEGGVVGRPHIAQLMVQRGYVKSIHEAFTRYLGESGAAHVRKDRLSVQVALDAIHAAGGLACLAHPVQLRLPSRDHLEHVLRRLKDMGLDGLETRHSDHTPADVDRFEKLADRFELLTCGGSDYHGSRKSVAMGSQRVPAAVYEALAARVRGPGGRTVHPSP